MFKPLDQLQTITLELTNKCNLRCRMCSIWKEAPQQNLALSQIIRLIDQSKKLSNISLTGGEPFLYPKLDLLYQYLYACYLKRKIRDIDIATNASTPELPKFLEKRQGLLAPLSLSISVDGLGNTHDRQRGKLGAFAATLQHIKAATRHHVPVTLKCVISSINHKQLLDIAKLADDLGCKFSFKLIEHVPAYYHRIKRSNMPLLSNAQKKSLLRTIEHPLIRKTAGPLETLSLEWHKKYLTQNNFMFIPACQTPSSCLFVTSHGNIYNCLYQRSIGTLAQWPKTLDFDAAQENIRNGLNMTCPGCLSYHGSIKTFHIKPNKLGQRK